MNKRLSCITIAASLIVAAGWLLVDQWQISRTAPRTSIVSLQPNVILTIRAASLTDVSAAETRKSRIGERGGFRLLLRVGLTHRPPDWGYNTPVSLRDFRVTDKSGKQTPIRRNYYGTATPWGTHRNEHVMDYTLPAVVDRENMAALTCTVVRGRDVGQPDIPLAQVTVQ